MEFEPDEKLMYQEWGTPADMEFEGLHKKMNNTLPDNNFVERIHPLYENEPAQLCERAPQIDKDKKT